MATNYSRAYALPGIAGEFVIPNRNEDPYKGGLNPLLLPELSDIRLIRSIKESIPWALDITAHSTFVNNDPNELGYNWEYVTRSSGHIVNMATKCRVELRESDRPSNFPFRLLNCIAGRLENMPESLTDYVSLYQGESPMPDEDVREVKTALIPTYDRFRFSYVTETFRATKSADDHTKLVVAKTPTEQRLGLKQSLSVSVFKQDDEHTNGGIKLAPPLQRQLVTYGFLVDIAINNLDAN